MDDTDIADIWADIETWLKANAPDRADELAPGATPDAIAALAARIGHPLPANYAASLARHDGRTDLSDYTYLSIAQIVDRWGSLAEQDRDGVFADRTIDDPNADVIARDWWNVGWLPFAKDSGGNLLCLDLVPGPKGRAGQVVRWERTMGPAPTEWPSFSAWLAAYRDGLQSGAYLIDEDGFVREA